MIIKFNQEVYSLKAIKNSVSQFKELAVFVVKKTDKYFEVNVTKIDKDVKDEIKNEFCNYVLYQMKGLN